MQKDEHFGIQNLTKGKLPRLPFRNMKNAVLGHNYTLSVAIIGNALSRKLNARRGKNEPTDILSFPLDKTHGEIFLNLTIAKKRALDFGQTFKNFVGYLFIHGLVHLKGLDHGSTMERIERDIRNEFNIQG